MYAELYQYLILYKELPVPGIGTFLLQRHSAVADFANRKFDPPAFSVALNSNESQPSINFFKWLGDSLVISEYDAVQRFNDFSFNLKKKVREGDIVNWDSVGTISKGLGGEIKFTASEKTTVENPIYAEKIIRQKSEHMVRVGEDERTSAEMTAILLLEVEKKSYWWAAALIIGLLSVMFLGWYFSEHGVEISSTANSKLLKPDVAFETYKLQP